MPRQEQIYIGQRKRRGKRLFPLLILLSIVAGSVWPHFEGSRLPRAGDAPSDAVIVLAGGENRVAAGVRAWREGKARQLFIVGAGPLTTLESIVPGYESIGDSDRRKIHIENWSETTLENAFSVKGVVSEHGIRTMVLVTSDYHLPRAHLALADALPGSVRVTVLPVTSEWKGNNPSWRKGKLFFLEAWKYWGYRLLLRWE